MLINRNRYFISLGIFIMLVVGGVLFSRCGKIGIDGYYKTTGIYLTNMDNTNGVTTAGTSVNENAYVLRIGYLSNSSVYDPNSDYTYKAGNHPTSIKVTTLQFFDSLHPANTSLNEFFIPEPQLSASIDDVLTGFVKSSINYYPNHPLTDLWLMKAPLYQGTYNFVVSMTFDDGITVSDTTSAIIFHQ